MRFLIVTIFILLLHFGTARADDLIGPNAAITPKDRETVKQLSLLAEKGDVRAQINLGNIFMSPVGHFLKHPRDEALKLYRMAADQGSAEADTLIGRTYLAYGDSAEAFRWLNLAVERGDADAAQLISYIYDPRTRSNGQGWSHWDALAILKQLAANGDKKAEFSLGRVLDHGFENGSSKDEKEAIKWYEAASSHGSTEADDALANIYITQHKGTKAYELFKRAADSGNDEAQDKISNLYLPNSNITKEADAKVKQYTVDALAGDKMAAFYLGGMYSRGDDVPKDEAEAYFWMRLAANLGMGLAVPPQESFGARITDEKREALDKRIEEVTDKSVQEWRPSVSAESGNLATRSECKNVPLTDSTFVRKLAENGDGDAQLRLGLFYANPPGKEGGDVQPGSFAADGKGHSSNYVEAVKWWRKAAEQGNAIAQFQMGQAYEYHDMWGNALERNDAEMMKWYQLAFENGVSQAMIFLKPYLLPEEVKALQEKHVKAKPQTPFLLNYDGLICSGYSLGCKVTDTCGDLMTLDCTSIQKSYVLVSKASKKIITQCQQGCGSSGGCEDEIPKQHWTCDWPRGIPKRLPVCPSPFTF